MVADANAVAWFRDLRDAVGYRLAAGHATDLLVVAEIADPRSDLALLRTDPAARTATPLSLAAAAGAVEVRWRGEGDLSGYDRPFGLGGRVRTVHATRTGRALQLVIDEGTDVKWNGLSGAPVLIDGRVAGVFSEVTYGASTAWASPVSALRDLLRLADDAALRADLGALLRELYGRTTKTPRQLAKALRPPLAIAADTAVADAADRIRERLVLYGCVREADGRYGWTIPLLRETLTDATDRDHRRQRLLAELAADPELWVASLGSGHSTDRDAGSIRSPRRG